MFFKDKGNGAKKTGARAWKPHSRALRECLQKVQRGANTHSYPERPNRCTGVRVLALDTGLGRVPGTGGHLVGSVDEEKGSAGPQLTVQTCVCVRVCLCTHMCGAYARVWYVDACTCV